MSDGQHQITRERILDGVVDEQLREAERLGLFVRLPDERRIEIRRGIREQLGPGDAWVFGYGSLIWNPAFHFAEQRHGRVHGWHRRFCLETPLGRGSPDAPGLMLGLDRGGSCNGVAFRIPADIADHELDIVFKREMISEAYLARTVAVHTAEGPVRAATFVINRDGDRYCPGRPLDEAARMIATAEGWLGPCSDYLFNTVEHLDELGLNDPQLGRLARRVREIQAAG